MDPLPRDHRSTHWAWREAGSGEQSIILLHGLGGSRLSWEPQFAGLSGGTRVIAWDLPGYGDGPVLEDDAGQPAVLTFPLLADAVVRFIDDVVDADVPVHLVGISFGGMIAQYAVARRPARFASLALLASSPMFGLDGTTPKAWRAARLAPLDAGLEPIDFADAVLGHLAGPTITEKELAGQRGAMARITGSALRRSIDCLVTHDSRSLLSHITTPTLCLVGELDAETPVAYSQHLVDHIPGAELHVVAGAGHLLNVEAPEVVNSAIAALVAAQITAHRPDGQLGGTT